MSRETYDVNVECPDCGYEFEVHVTYSYSPGIRYPKWGNPEPPEQDWDYQIPEHCGGCKKEFTEKDFDAMHERITEYEPPSSQDEFMRDSEDE